MITDEKGAAPPSSSATEHPPLKTPKDKTCPFCGQAFTSSSLGRHLDLYIRPRNPKKPDGKHDVEEIRKMRGNITRRNMMKGSAVKNESASPPEGSTQSAGRDARDTSPTMGPLAQSPAEDDNSLSRRASDTKTPEARKASRRDVSRQKRKVSLDQRHQQQQQQQEQQEKQKTAEDNQAVELALKELLRGVREASVRAAGCGLFDFDPYTLNFPSLCLRLLPAPSTLFSPTPFPTSESWSIHPPGQKQFDALNRQVRERLLAHQRQRQANQSYPSVVENSPLPTPPLYDPEPQKLFGHLADAYHHWAAHTDQQRQEAWQLEILRSYVRVDQQRREVDASLESARSEIQYLKAERASSAPSETSPIHLSIGCETVKGLEKLGIDFRNWDYDQLIEKWKGIVKEGKRASSGMAAQKQLPISTTRSGSIVSLPTQFSAANGTGLHLTIPPNPYSSAPPTVNGTEPSSDQADAEGEDDDEVDADINADINAEAASDEGSISHHPPHGLPLQPTPHHPPQVTIHTLAQANAQYQAHVQVQAHAQAQAQAQAQAWAAARQHMNHSQNQHHHPHQELLSPHPSHIGSGANSRRSSHAFIDTTHTINTAAMLPMEGIEAHQNHQFLRMGMGLADNFVGSNGDRV